jgi:hypothetical protein
LPIRCALGQAPSTEPGSLLYDGGMGYVVAIAPEPGSDSWTVVLKVKLSRAESNDLFLRGDSMVSWPAEGLEPAGEPKFERTGLFVSEVSARPLGLMIRYREEAQAARAAALLRMQFAQMGIKEGG